MARNRPSTSISRVATHLHADEHGWSLSTRYIWYYTCYQYMPIRVVSQLRDRRTFGSSTWAAICCWHPSHNHNWLHLVTVGKTCLLVSLSWVGRMHAQNVERNYLQLVPVSCRQGLSFDSWLFYAEVHSRISLVDHTSDKRRSCRLSSDVCWFPAAHP